MSRVTRNSISTGPWFVYKCELNVCFYPQYSDYEKVVIEDRVAKEQARRKAEQELEELKAATKVSSEKRFCYSVFNMLEKLQSTPDSHFVLVDKWVDRSAGRS